MNFKKNTNASASFRALLLLWGVLAVSCLLIFRRFLFGNCVVVFNDAGADTRQQYLMQYATIVNHIKNGNFSLWDLNNGFGTSMFSLSLTNLFLFPVYLVGLLRGVGYIAGAVVYLLIAEIFLAASFCFLFLGCFSFSNRSKVIASYLYGMNGFLLVWGQHYHFGVFVVLLPLLWFLLERAIRRRRCSLCVPILVAVMICASVYMSYMALLATGFYVLLRMIASDDPPRRRIRLFFTHCGTMLLGIALGAFAFLPTARYLLTVSSRMDAKASFLSRMLGYLRPFASSFYKTALLRLFSSTFEGIRNYHGTSNFYEAPLLFFSVLFVILALQYLCTIHRQTCSRKNKILQYLAVALVFFFVLTQIGACIFNAFAYPISRYTFACMPLFALVTAFTLDQILIRKKLSVPVLLLTIVLIVCAHVTALKSVNEPVLTHAVILYAGCALAMCLLLFLGSRRNLHIPRMFSRKAAGALLPASDTAALSSGKHSKRALRAISLLLLLLCTANASIEGFLCYNDRDVLTTDDPVYWGGLYDPNVTQALDYLRTQDNSLFRTEKDYFSGSICMDALAQNYRSISTYNSTPNRNLEEFTDLVLPNFATQTEHMYSYRQIGWYTGHTTLFGIKYLLSHNGNLQLDGFVREAQFGDVFVYRNTNVSSLVRFYSKTGDSAILDDAYPSSDLERMLLETLLLEKEDLPKSEEYQMQDILSAQYSLEELPVKIDDIHAKGKKASVSIPISREATRGYKRLYLSFDIFTPEYSDLTLNPEDAFACHFLGYAKQKQHIQLALSPDADSVVLERYNGNLKGKITNIRLLGSKQEISSSGDGTVILPDTSNDSCISGTVNSDDGGYLFLPVPYEDGWKAEIDGSSTEILRADRGFQAIRVDAGTHTFTFTYTQPLLKEGIAVSLAAFAVLLTLVLLRLRRSRKSPAGGA